MKQIIFLFFLIVMPNSLYSQSEMKIVPAQQIPPYPLGKWGYKDLQGNWIIPPQYSKANSFNKDGIAEVIPKSKKAILILY